jgi:prepilin-type N-terminal cleavage/methylation domain-containing protein
MMTLRIGRRIMARGVRKEIGFTLIEVLLSVMILSFGLIVVNQTLLRSLSHLSYSQARFQANQVMERKIFETRKKAWSEKKRPPSRDNGVLLENRTSYSFESQSVSVRGSKFLYEVRMAIHWLDSGKEKGFSRTFYIQLPYVVQA